MQSFLYCFVARTLTLVILVSNLGACSNGRILLNSERIEQRFGSFGIELLAGDDQLRRANLYSVENGEKICRTYAVVQFPRDLDTRYATEHSAVVGGASLGAVFKKNGWRVDKHTLHIGTLLTGQANSEMVELMRLGAPLPVALHVYQVIVTKNDWVIPYAMIAEAHHPEYLQVNDLESIYPLDSDRALTPSDVAAFSALYRDR